ncbi:hypothetical protein ES332_A04G040300v1 [Gossypium tomentosum]|uniref:Uncharacterized protein n=1 Tax=Gossypium tomentosum TaxID=34277 RepID=A0A5D2QU58_GOSTO|nr:hypothetical protein ES332_A04G040300v1 [Gossypium tomentosum]
MFYKEVASFCKVKNLADRVAGMGLGEISVKIIQGNYFLIEIPDDELYDILKQGDWSYLKEFFIHIAPWSEKLIISERVTWIEVSGIPIYCWNYETFKRITGKWGVNNFEKVEMMISISQVQMLNEIAFLEVGDIRFPIRIKERGWSEELKSKDNSVKKERKQGMFVKSVSKSESMKIVSWNIRGLGSNIKIAMVNRLETKLVEVSRDMISRMWGNDNFDFRFTAAVGRSGGLITIWDKASFMLKKDMCSNRLIVVQGLWCSEGDQRFFWEEIIEIREQFTNHWIVGGDFNTIRNKSGRSNCVGLLRGSRDFGKFIEKCKLVDLPLLGKKTFHTTIRHLISIT